MSMLVKLPQMKQSWCVALVLTLQTKIDHRETKTADTRRTKALKIPACCISESNKTRFDSLCSKIRATSSTNNSLLTAKLEPMSTDRWKTDVTGLNIDDEREAIRNSVADMEVDAIHSEVIEISDDSPEKSSYSKVKVPNPPGINPVEFPQKAMDITALYPVVSPTAPTSEALNIPDDSTLHETREIPVDSSVASSSLPLSQLPNPSELEIQNIEVELSGKDAPMNQYSQLKNHLLTCSENLDVELQEFLNCFLESTFKASVTVLTSLEISTIPESSIIMLVKQFLLLERECSFQATVIFAEYCIGVWLVALQQAASRNLLAVVTAFAQKHAKAFVVGIMVKQFNATSLMRPQCDLIVKVVKNFEKETLQYFLEKLVQSNEADSHLFWNEDMILLLSTVLERKLDLDVSIFEKFVNWLQSQSLPLANSLKFAKLVLTIINKYGPLVKTRLPTVKQILEENNTFLKKSGLTALKKLED